MSRHVDEEILETFRSAEYCDVCGVAIPKGLRADPHHVISRGAGGPDIPENLIACDRTCHTKMESGQIPKLTQLTIIAYREEKSIGEIQQIAWETMQNASKAQSR